MSVYFIIVMCIRFCQVKVYVSVFIRSFTFWYWEKKKQKGVEQKRVADERVRKFFVGK